MSAVDELRALADAFGCDLYGREDNGLYRIEARPRTGGRLSFSLTAYGSTPEGAAASLLEHEAWRKTTG